MTRGVKKKNKKQSLIGQVYVNLTMTGRVKQFVNRFLNNLQLYVIFPLEYSSIFSDPIVANGTPRITIIITRRHRKLTSDTFKN